MIMAIWLVVWNMNFMTFHILGIIIPTDELIFFRGVGQPPTSIGYVGASLSANVIDKLDLYNIAYMDIFICIYLNRVLLWSVKFGHICFAQP